MRRGELFDLPELRTPLSLQQKEGALRRIVRLAHCGEKYAYTVKEACGILSISRDEINHLIHSFRLDAVSIGAIYRISWYALSEYLLDTANDIDEVYDEYIRSRYRTV